MGGGGYGGHAPAGEGADRDQMRDRMERVRALFEPVERLTITEDGDAVTMVDGEGRSERLVPNGKKEQHLVGNTQAELKTAWQDGRLVSDIALGGGLHFKRTIALDTAAEGVRRLTIELKTEGGMGGDRPPVRRIYDLIE
jgi:hypothetical protein